MKLVAVPENPVPEGAVVGTLKTPDGTDLRFARFQPPPGRKGTLCLFPGRSEFIEKYFEMVRDCQARGFAVAVLDWRGQGLSARALPDRRKGHVADFSEYDIDIESFMKDVVLPDCPPPIFAIAHSMGAAIVIRAAHRGRRWFDRVVLSAPMIAPQLPRMPGFAKAATHVLKTLGLGHMYVPGGGAKVLSSLPFPRNPLTSDPVRYARIGAIIEAESALAIGSPTVAWMDAAFQATSEFAESGYSSRIRQAMLIVGAGQDSVVSTEAIEQFAGRLRAGSHLVIAGARHEILMERDRYRAQFWAAFDAFVPGSPAFA